MEKAKPSIGQRFSALWERFSDKEYRRGFYSSQIGDRLAIQIRTMRTARGWTQADLAERANMLQPRISKLEDSCEGASLKTLKAIADAFDVGLKVRLVAHSCVLEEALAHSADLDVPSFKDDRPERTAHVDIATDLHKRIDIQSYYFPDDGGEVVVSLVQSEAPRVKVA